VIRKIVETSDAFKAVVKATRDLENERTPLYRKGYEAGVAATCAEIKRTLDIQETEARTAFERATATSPLDFPAGQLSVINAIRFLHPAFFGESQADVD
jgi:hypothetical protein